MISSLYRKADGRIIGKLRHDGNASGASAKTGQIDGEHDGTLFYVDVTADPPAVVTRPLSPIGVDRLSIAADGEQTATFGPIPAGAVLVLDGGAPMPVGDASVVFNATVKGTYSFVFRNFPHQDAKFLVTAT